MTLQYDQPNINLQGVQAVSTFIFDSSLAQQTDIAFNDWSALLAKAQETVGIVRIMFAGAGVNSIPAGTYDMTDIFLVGETAFASASVNDVIFNNLLYIESLIIQVGIAVANTVPTFQYNSGGSEVLTLKGVNFLVGGLGVAEIFAVTGVTTLRIIAEESAFLSINVGVPVITVDATSTVITAASGGTGGNSWGGGDGDPAFVSVTAGGSFELGLATGDLFWAANQALGPTVVTRKDDYEAAVVGDWSGTQPLNVKAALDRIAAAIGPIA